MDLTLYHAEISQVLQIIHHLFNIEGAVFDDSAVLVTGSKGYLERKGTAVHKPSIMEVIENDEVIVLRRRDALVHRLPLQRQLSGDARTLKAHRH